MFSNFIRQWKTENNNKMSLTQNVDKEFMVYLECWIEIANGFYIGTFKVANNFAMKFMDYYFYILCRYAWN